MRLSDDQMAILDLQTTRRALDEGLRLFETDTRESDPELSGQIRAYRTQSDHSMYARIVALTDRGTYQRAVLALCLQSGIDMTTAPEFSYIMQQPALSGNTKARHIVLMAMAFQRVLEGTT